MIPADITRSIICLLLLLLVGPVAAEETLKVVSYNIRQDTASDTGGRDWRARKRALTGYLHDGKFSIIGLQEVRHNQLLDVNKALPRHEFTGVGRDDGKTRGEYSPIYFHTGFWKLDPEQHGTFWLSDTPDVVRSRTWGNRYPRICTWARLIGRDGPVKGRGDLCLQHALGSPEPAVASQVREVDPGEDRIEDEQKRSRHPHGRFQRHDRQPGHHDTAVLRPGERPRREADAYREPVETGTRLRTPYRPHLHLSALQGGGGEGRVQFGCGSTLSV